MSWKEQWNEVKKAWIVFLLFGIVYIIISAGVSTYVSTKISEELKGDPCRIDVPVEKFLVKNGTSFNIEYLLINLRDKDLQIENLEVYCYWKSEEDAKKQNENLITKPPSIDDISTPQELPKIDGSKSQVKKASCKSPQDKGSYKIRLIARTTEGICEGSVIMEVENE